MFLAFRLVRRIAYLLVTAALVYYLVCAGQVLAASRASETVAAAPRSAAVVVVSPPGNATAGGGSGVEGSLPSRDYRALLERAVALLHDKKAPRVILLTTTAGTATAGRRYLSKQGVASKRIFAVTAAQLPAAFRSLRKGLPAGVPQSRAEVIVVTNSLDALLVDHLVPLARVRANVSSVSTPGEGPGGVAASVALQAGAIAWGRLAGFAQTGFIVG